MLLNEVQKLAEADAADQKHIADLTKRRLCPCEHQLIEREKLQDPTLGQVF